MKIGTWYPMCEPCGRKCFRKGLDVLTKGFPDENDTCAHEGCDALATHEYWPGDEMSEAAIEPEEKARIEEALGRAHFDGDESSVAEMETILDGVAARSRQ